MSAAFPQARVVAVAECGTHTVFDAVVGSYGTAEVVLARERKIPNTNWPEPQATNPNP